MATALVLARSNMDLKTEFPPHFSMSLFSPRPCRWKIAWSLLYFTCCSPATTEGKSKASAPSERRWSLRHAFTCQGHVLAGRGERSVQQLPRSALKKGCVCRQGRGCRGAFGKEGEREDGQVWQEHGEETEDPEDVTEGCC